MSEFTHRLLLGLADVLGYAAGSLMDPIVWIALVCALIWARDFRWLLLIGVGFAALLEALVYVLDAASDLPHRFDLIPRALVFWGAGALLWPVRRVLRRPANKAVEEQRHNDPARSEANTTGTALSSPWRGLLRGWIVLSGFWVAFFLLLFSANWIQKGEPRLISPEISDQVFTNAPENWDVLSPPSRCIEMYPLGDTDGEGLAPGGLRRLTAEEVRAAGLDRPYEFCVQHQVEVRGQQRLFLFALALLVIGPPLALLILILGVRWVAQGFATPKNVAP